jgi:hypothetical protein
MSGADNALAKAYAPLTMPATANEPVTRRALTSNAMLNIASGSRAMIELASRARAPGEERIERWLRLVDMTRPNLGCKRPSGKSQSDARLVSQF